MANKKTNKKTSKKTSKRTTKKTKLVTPKETNQFSARSLYVENDKPEAVMTDGTVISLKPVPQKRQLLNALRVIAHQLTGTSHGDTVRMSLSNRTLSDLVGDLRHQDFLTRKEAMTLNKRYSLGLIL